MTTTERAPHLDDGELVRFIDQEGDAIEIRQWHRHVDTCGRCAGAVDALRSDAALIRDWLRRADFEADVAPVAPPAHPKFAARRQPTPWLRAAAILLLVAAPLAALPSVRGWVAEQVRGTEQPAQVSHSAVPLPDAATVLRFTPTPGVYTVRFEAGATGVLVLQRSSDQQATLRARGGEPEAVVASSLLRIRNTGPALYVLHLPSAVTRARILIGEREVQVTPRQIEQGTEIELATPAPTVAPDR